MIRQYQFPARDNVLLAAEVYLPDSGGPFPLVVIRSPYSVCGTPQPGVEHILRQGIGYLLQDCRGTGKSEGTADYWRQEVQDAADLFAWLKTQDWFNGHLVMSGESYCGAVQWQALRSSEAGVIAGFAPNNAPLDCYDGVYYPNGVFGYDGGIYWALLQRHLRLHGTELSVPENTLHSLPLCALDEKTGLGRWDAFQHWLAHPEKDAYWESLSAYNAIPKIRVPAFITGGWFDPFIRQTLRAFTAMRNSAATPEAREYTRLIIEPVTHTMTPGGGDYGKFFRAGLIGLRSQFLRNRLLTPDEDPLPDLPPIRFFLMGSNQWIDAAEWPIPAEQYTLYLNGEKLTPAPGGNGTRSFVYDPADPVPTTGGASIGFLSCGQKEQSPVENRADVLVYTTEVLPEDLHIIGGIRAVLYAESSAPETAFTVKICDVHPDGSSWNVCDGIIGTAHRNGNHCKAPALTPGEVVCYSVDCGVTAMTFRQGHRLRVQISSSNFPMYARNPNTGNPFHEETSFRKAEQTVHHGKTYPARLLLPVVKELP